MIQMYLVGIKTLTTCDTISENPGPCAGNPMLGGLRHAAYVDVES